MFEIFIAKLVALLLLLYAVIKHFGKNFLEKLGEETGSATGKWISKRLGSLGGWKKGEQGLVGQTQKHMRRSNQGEILKQIKKGGSKILIFGDSGLGKTHLAKTLYHEIGKSKRAFWVEYENNLRSSLLRTINVDGQNLTEQQRFDKILEELQENPKKTVLFVDNVTKLPQEDEWLGRLSGSPITVVLTSKKRFMDGYDHSWEVEKLSPEEAVALFDIYYRGKRRKKDIGYVHRLAELAHYNTLTLKHMAQCIEEGMSLEKYCRKLSVLDRKSLNECLDILFDVVQMEREQRRILWNFAVMPMFELPVEVCKWIDCDKSDLDVLADQQDWLEKTENGYILHEMKRKAILVHDIPEEALSAFINYVGNGQFFKSGADTEVYTTVQRKTEIAEAVLGQSKLGNLDYAHACDYLASALANMAMYDKALAYYKEALEIKKAIYDKNHPDTAATYNNLGVVYDSQGNYPKALEHYDKALKIYQAVHGENAPDTASSYNNLGIVYAKQGDYPKALEHFDQALKIKKAVYGEIHPSTASTYNNLGVVYQKQGDYPKALEHFDKALKIRKQVLGESHPDTADTYNNLGVVYDNQGDYPKALEHYEKALKIRKQVLGESHPDTADTYNNSGIVYRNQGDYPKALEHYEKALKIYLAVHGDNHPDTAATYGNLGIVYTSMGEHEKAAELASKAYRIFLQTLGPEHPNTKKSYRILQIDYENLHPRR